MTKGRVTMTEITYTEVNGYQIPNLTVPHQTVQIGKYGQMRRKYLKQSRPSLYSSLMITGMITEHLLEVERTATEQIQSIIQKMAQTEGVTEELKAANQMAWVGAMNSIRNRAEEIILRELIYGEDAV